MRQSSKVQGTKIAQAAKDLNVTSVTIRRYLSEFDIQTTTDSNGIKVLPDSALEELKEVRRLKEDGMTNPKVMEALEEMRAKSGSGSDSSDKADKKKTVSRAKRVDSKSSRSKSDDEDENEESESESEEEEPKAKPSYAARRIESKKHQSNEAAESTDSSESSELSENSTQDSEEGESIDSSDAMGDKEGRVKHSLTCQTCSKVFEHMNPKLRDCLDCYRTKRKERRRGGSDRHKTVIQHPIAQQVTNKMASQQQQNQESNERERQAPNQERERPQRNNRNDRNDRNDRGDRSDRNNERNYDRDSEQTNFNAPAAVSTHQGPSNQPMVGGLMRKVRSYRKAIEDTRQITGSLKRRLERPDLPEGERRWLEQIYAYQLILHQGWRHLSEYRMATQQQGKED
ncbi:MAG: MerR family transcriptional regulator [Cyanobacteria bacterium TGS_CYA1]|nr:MerR family transcriptional regulator [Cyanobacteria bacterium TGS_CYA1]